VSRYFNFFFEQSQMALFKLCSRSLLTQRALQPRTVAPVFLTIRRRFSDKGTKGKFDSYRDGGVTKFEKTIDAVKDSHDKKLGRKPKVDLGDLEDPTITKLKAKFPEFKKFDEKSMAEGLEDPAFKKLLDADPTAFVEQNFETKQELAGEYIIKLKPSEGKLTPEEHNEQAEELYENWPQDPSLPINEVLPFREKGKAADPGESFGPAKAEFDSWKRIYKEEESFERLGLPPRAHYWRDGEMYSPFGTLSNPVKVYSQFSHRIVGCRGGNGKAHEIVWINLGNKYKTMCPECGQMYMLVNFKPEEAERPGENLHELEKTANDGHLKEPQMY